MNPASIPIPDNEFTLEELDSELLLYHPTKTTAVYLNPTAAIIWRLCDGERTVGEITELIKDSYPEAGGGIEADVEAALETFIDNGAITL
jgi:hypothetical protein